MFYALCTNERGWTEANSIDANPLSKKNDLGAAASLTALGPMLILHWHRLQPFGPRHIFAVGTSRDELLRELEPWCSQLALIDRERPAVALDLLAKLDSDSPEESPGRVTKLTNALQKIRQLVRREPSLQKEQIVSIIDDALLGHLE